MGRLPPSDINRFVCLPIFDPRHPSAQGTSAPSETHLPAMLLASWEFHPSEDRSEPLSFVATVLSRSTLGLNGSIIIASACYRLRADCLHRLSPEGIKMRSLMWLAGFADSRRNVKNALCYFVFKEHRGNQKAPSLSMPKSKGG